MSELNIYHHELRPDEYDEFYLKYEADKVIADLEDRLQAADKQIENLINSASSIMLFQDRVTDDKCAELRHSNYKRCLAMARWCRSRSCFYDTMRENSLCWGWKSDRAYKWHKRWLELAEKFKEEG